MSNAGILYLRLLRKIVRESAWRLGGGEETFLAAGFGGDLSGGDLSGSDLSGSDRSAGPPVIRGEIALDGKAECGGKAESVAGPGCGHQRERCGSARS